MIKLFSAAEARKASMETQKKLMIKQKENVYKAIEAATKLGKTKLSLPWTEVEFCVKIVTAELRSLGFEVNTTTPVMTGYYAAETNVSKPGYILVIDWSN